MTIYYTTTFFLLVVEMIAFGLLVIPLPSRWRRVVLKFASTSPLVAKALSALKIIFGFIFVLFIDAVNKLQRITESEPEGAYHDHSQEAAQKASKFYAQRNLYLCGFTLFLSLILERTSTLLIQMLKHEEELEYAKKEHNSSKEDEKRLLNMEKSYENNIQSLEKELNELRQQERDFVNLKKQVEQQTTEYHQLAKQRAHLDSSEPKKNI